jgi:mono/diheme cytochrome c family protein
MATRAPCAAGSMGEVVSNSTQKSIGLYLKSLPGSGLSAPQPLAATDPAMKLGSELYRTNCIACHKSNGDGVDAMVPSLANNPGVRAAGANNGSRTILAGGRGAATTSNPTSAQMPAFAWKLSDADVAAIAKFIRNSWGNSAAAVEATQVGSNEYMRNGNLYASKFGFKGTEPLGSGLSAVFDLQEGFDPGTGTQQSDGLAFNRYAFVGLQDTRAGTLTLGRQYTPYYLLAGTFGLVTYLTGATGAHPGDIDGFDTDIHSNSSVTYTSPTISGLRGGVQYGFGGVAHKSKVVSTVMQRNNSRSTPPGKAAVPIPVASKIVSIKAWGCKQSCVAVHVVK